MQTHANYALKLHTQKKKKEKERERERDQKPLISWSWPSIFTNMVFPHPPGAVNRSCCFFSSSSLVFKTFKGSSIPTVKSGGPVTEHDNLCSTGAFRDLGAGAGLDNFWKMWVRVQRDLAIKKLLKIFLFIFLIYC